MAARRPSSARIDRKHRIVAAASRLFSEHRFVDVQMDDVARSAGVAKPTLYRYFATKEDLFLEALGGILDDLGRRAEAAADAPTATEALNGVIAIVLDTLGRCTAALQALDGGPHIGERGRLLVRAKVRGLRG